MQLTKSLAPQSHSAAGWNINDDPFGYFFQKRSAHALIS